MPDFFVEPLARLIREFQTLPGIGQKSAQRLAFHLLRTPREDAARLALAVLDVKDLLGLCVTCNNISDRERCKFCSDSRRDRSQICIVEELTGIVAIESTRAFVGLYHVLHGTISPLRDVGPDQLKIQSLLERIGTGEVREIILATNPNVEGEATAAYLSWLLQPLAVRVTRIGMGIPVGSDMDCADEVTMGKALENRREV